MVKVLFLITDLSYGGAERVLVNLANNMDKTKFKVTVQTLFDVGVNKNKLNNDVEYIGGFKRQFRGNSKIMKLFRPKTLCKRVIRDNYDLVISFLEGPPSRIVSAYEGKKIAWIHIEQKNIVNASLAFRDANEARKCYNAFNRVVCVSKTVKEDFSKIFNLNVPIDVLYNVNETDTIKRLSEKKQEIIVSSNESYNIISVGRLSCAHKGYDRLVRVHKKLIENGINNKLYILGEGSDREKLECLIKQLGIENSCFLLGFDENPYKYVKNADLFVCSSHHEGFSTAVTEALIVGTPVVSTLVSGAKELLGENNEYGIVCKNDEHSLYESIFEILSSDDVLSCYKERAIIRGRQFDKRITVKVVEDYLEELVNEKED